MDDVLKALAQAKNATPILPTQTYDPRESDAIILIYYTDKPETKVQIRIKRSQFGWKIWKEGERIRLEIGKNKEKKLFWLLQLRMKAAQVEFMKSYILASLTKKLRISNENIFSYLSIAVLVGDDDNADQIFDRISRLDFRFHAKRFVEYLTAFQEKIRKIFLETYISGSAYWRELFEILKDLSPLELVHLINGVGKNLDIFNLNLLIFYSTHNNTSSSTTFQLIMQINYLKFHDHDREKVEILLEPLRKRCSELDFGLIENRLLKLKEKGNRDRAQLPDEPLGENESIEMKRG